MSETTTQRLWGPYPIVAELFGMSRGWLEELVAAGHVRRRCRRKGVRQARCIYRIADIATHLDGEADTAGGAE